MARVRQLRPIIVTLAVLACGAAAGAADALDELVKNSPFGQRAADSPPGNAAGPLELRGVFTDQGEVFFSIYETSSRVATWVGLNESGNPYTVRRYDAAKGSVAVEYQGREVSLQLKQAKVQAMAVTAPPSGPGPAPMPTSLSGTGQGAGAPAAQASTEEARRLAAIADEIGRRRALRAQAGRAQSAPPAVGTPPPK